MMSVYSATIGVVFGKQFGDDGQTGFLACLRQQLQPLLAESLEFVGRRARLERAAAQEGRPGGLHGLGGGQQLFLAFDRARPGHDVELFAADDVFADADGGIGRMRLAADELVTLLDGHDALNGLGKLRDQRFEVGVGEFVADGADDGARHAAHDVGGVAEFADFLEDGLFLFSRNPGFEHDDHGFLWVGRRSQNKNAAGVWRPAAIGLVKILSQPQVRANRAKPIIKILAAGCVVCLRAVHEAKVAERNPPSSGAAR
jgi:hypothetical protein